MEIEEDMRVTYKSHQPYPKMSCQYRNRKLTLPASTGDPAFVTSSLVHSSLLASPRGHIHDAGQWGDHGTWTAEPAAAAAAAAA